MMFSATRYVLCPMRMAIVKGVPRKGILASSLVAPPLLTSAVMPLLSKTP